MDLQKLKTTYCETKEAECLIEGKALDIGYIVIGDGNGETPVLSKDMTSLRNQRCEMKITVDKSDLPKYKFIADIPNNIESFPIRELGLTDGEGNLLFVSQMDGTMTNILNSGIAKQIRLQVQFIPSDGVNIILIDPATTVASVDFVNKNFPKLDENGQISKDVLPPINLNTKYSVNSGAVDESGNPAYLVSYTEDVEIPATDETAEPTTETHTYLKLLAGTVYTDDKASYTVASDVIVEITDKNTADITYNVFVEHTGGEDVLTIKENLVEVANVGTTPTVAEGAETVEDNYLLIPQEPLQAYWVDSTTTKTPTSAVNIGSYDGGVTKPLIKDFIINGAKKEVRLVESYQNGASWYRLFSDGWCEQGGTLTKAGFVTFLKPYKNENFNIDICDRYPSKTKYDNDRADSISSHNLAQFGQFGWTDGTGAFITSPLNQGAKSRFWKACGYTK